MYYLAAPGCKCVFCPRGSHRSALWHLRQNCCQSHGAAAQAHTCDWRLSRAISRIRLAIFHISQCVSPAHSTFRLPYPVCGTSPCVPAAEMWSSSHRSQIRGFIIIIFFYKRLTNFPKHRLYCTELCCWASCTQTGANCLGLFSVADQSTFGALVIVRWSSSSVDST